MEYIGRNGSRILFVSEDFGAIVDEANNLVITVDVKEPLIAAASWDLENNRPNGPAVELASAALTDLDIKVFSNNDRMYTIPDSVIAEAKRGLEWRKEEDRGGTSVGLNTARTLARGGQVGIRKVRHIAKYFPRHEVDKKGTGYKPGQKNYPSNGRIAWALWGGDAAQRWASAIVERENKKNKSNSITAGGLDPMDFDVPKRINYDSFMLSKTMPEDNTIEFYVRIRLDGSGIDRLYRIEPQGNIYVWDDGDWDDMDMPDADMSMYDKVLDDHNDKTPCGHMPVDTETALLIAALLDNEPFIAHKVDKLYPEESKIYYEASQNLDTDLLDEISLPDEMADYWDLDDSLTAAGETPSSSAGDGIDTPEEKAARAQKQLRDKSGKFAKMGGRVIIGGRPQYQGNIRSIDPATKTVGVELDNGRIVNIAASMTEPVETYTSPMNTFIDSELDTSGILGEPRTPMGSSVRMPGTLPPLNGPNIQTMLYNYPQWVSDERLSPEASPVPTQNGTAPSAAPETSTPAQPQGVEKEVSKDNPLYKYYPEKFTNWNKAVNAYNIPLLKNWLEAGPESRRKYNPFVDPEKTKKFVEERGIKSPKLDKQGRPLKAAAGDEKAMTPETSDVPILHMAVVSPDDPQAVLELVALVPASNKTIQPTTFIRKDGKWVHDPQVLMDLNSATPPPVVVLDDATLVSVLEQVDGKTESITAAGGLDRNRGQAEKLRRYWLYGKGAAKIRWRTPGDWTRCYRQLAKYMGPRAKGYCALRHREANGYWPGDKKNREMSSFTVNTMRDYDELLSSFALRAKAADARSRVMTAGGSMEEEYGSEFFIPLVIPEGVESGDGRVMEKGALTTRELPLPLLWQIQTGEGHNGSVVVGKIVFMERTDSGIGNAKGYFDKGAYGQEAERLVRGGFIRGVSADLDQFEADEEVQEVKESSDTKIESGKIKIKKARVMAVTLVPKPAFQECSIQLADELGGEEEEVNIPDGVYVEGVNPLDASALVACGMIAGAIPVVPPKEWFNNPKLSGPTPLTVDDSGKVYGHIAAWHVDHIGMSMGTKPPRSRSGYSYFHTGILRTDDGSDVPVGQLTLAGGHAPLEASASEAVRHYDDTASAIADVHAGEDAYGIWVAGSLRPGSTPEQIRALRASAPSGDWRPIKNSLELVAVCQVNVPGFPIARARVASGSVMALVAAGAQVLAQLKQDPLSEMQGRIEALEKPQKDALVAAANEARARIQVFQTEELEKRKALIAAKIAKVKTDSDIDSDYMNEMFDDNPENEMAVISRRVRMRLAKEGKALPDGSYPIRNPQDLKNAIRAYGRSRPGSRGKVKRHIVKRAIGLNREELIPENWKGAAADLDEIVASMKTIAEVVSASLLPSKDDFSGNSEAVLSAIEFAEEISEEEIADLTDEEIEALKEEAKTRKAQENDGISRDEDGRPKFTPDTQPRDASGKFRQVLARIKQDLGTSGLDRVLDKIQEAENFDSTGDYAGAAKAAGDLLDIIDRLDAGALNAEALENVRLSAGELGKVIANLPFAFGEDAEKIRFSDVPPALRDLMEDMIVRVEDKIGQEDADIATEGLRKFMSGGDYFNQSEISSEMAKLLRLLT
jgi:hypothetical protein